MKKTIFSSLAGVCIVAFCGTAVADDPYWASTPMECHWIGAVYKGTSTYGQNAAWTDPSNWAEGIVPGRFVVDGVTNGCAGCTAVFDRACTYKTVDLDGLVSISNIVVTGPNAPAIELGKWQWATPALIFERLGGIYVGADVPTAPIVHASIRYYKGEANTVSTLYHENNSASELQITGFSGPESGFSGYVGVCTTCARGTGDIRQTSVDGRSGFVVQLRLGMTGGKYVYGVNNNQFNLILSEAGAGAQHIVIPEGITLKGVSGSMIRTSTDLLIDGPGTFALTDTGDFTYISTAAGTTLTIDSPITRPAGKGIQIGWWDYYGTVTLTSTNTFDGGVKLFGATLSVSDFGTVGQPGPIGSGPTIFVDSSTGTIRYTGDGGTLPQTISMAAPCRVYNDGEGELKLTGGATTSANKILTLNGRIAVACDILAPVTFAAGSAIAFRKADAETPAAFTLSSVTLGGDMAIPVEDGVTATITAIVNNGHALDLQPVGSGKVIFGGLAAGFAPDWLTVNGKKAIVSASGEVTSRDGKADDYSIDAHGGVIPDASGAVVAITTAAGAQGQHVTLAEDATAVMMLRQRQSVDEAQVDLAAGQTLLAGVVTTETDAKPLTVGAAPGTGTLAPNGGTLELETKGASGRITVNADVGLTAGARLVKSGEGVATLAGSVSGRIDLEAGALVVTNGDAGVTLSGGPATLSVAGGLGAAERFDLVVSNGAVNLSGRLCDSEIVVGSNGTGRLTFTDGCVTGALQFARGTGSRGVFRQTGGEFVDVVQDQRISFNGYANLKIDGGTHKRLGKTLIGSEGYAVFEQTGGEFVATNDFMVGTDGRTGVLRFKGGTTTFNCDVRMPTYNQNGAGILTVEGDATVKFLNNKSLQLALAADNYTFNKRSMVNLNGGTLSAYTLSRHGWYSNATEKAYLNFNGGTYDYIGWGSPFGSSSTWTYYLDRVTVYEKGATLGVRSGYGPATIYVPISAPEGLGVASVAWTAISGLPGTPAVIITDAGGTGEGASAFADVDDYGTITNIHVTSPGWNYTNAKANLYCGGSTPIATFDCTLAPQVSGGLTKTGSGTMTLYCTNTYTGATTVKGGTLKLAAPDVIDARSELILDGGTLDLNDMAQTFSSVGGTSGTILNGTLRLSGLKVDMAVAAAGTYPTVTAPVAFAPGAEVSVLNASGIGSRHSCVIADLQGEVTGTIELSAEAADDLAAAAGGNWALQKVGTRLRLARVSGTAVIVR